MNTNTLNANKPFINCGDISYIIDGSICLSDEEVLKKTELINTLHHKVSYCNTDGETCYCVIVPLDKETSDVLNKLGLSNKDIMENARWDKSNKQIVIELTEFACQFARWWDEKAGFSINKPNCDY